MSYYLLMDGIDDYLRSPTLEHDQVVIDVAIDKLNGRQYITSSSSSTTVRTNSAGLETWSGFITVKLNGVVQTNLTAFIPNTRIVLDAHSTSAFNYSTTIFATGGVPPSAFAKGKIYNVKIYLRGELLAHYDLTLGHAQDISGKGNHATVSGGTFIYEAPPVNVYARTVTDSISLSDDISRKLEKFIADSIGINDVIFANSRKSILISDSLTLLESLTKDVNISATDSLILLDGAHSGVAIYATVIDNVDFDDQLVRESDQIIGKITLSGNVETNVYLVGERILNVILRGDVN